MSSVTEQIKDRVSIVDVVSPYLKLEKAGANFKASCPFHNEKTPSFFISPDRGTYYCFGCGAKGDIFSFVQQFESVDFPQALAQLAEKAGVKLVEEDPSIDAERKRLNSLLEQATLFFGRTIHDPSASASKEAKAYVLKRGLTEKTMREWRIGYAGAEWRTLLDHLVSADAKFTPQEIVAVGLAKYKGGDPKSSESYYDVFRSRIVFPIWNASGKIVGFSGRIFPQDDKAPKYLNTPETALFKKSDLVYGFDRAKTSIRKKGYSIVVEGQMDLVMSHQAGYTNTVATSGTALTELHLRRLAKISPKVMFVFDNDSAGVAAARRAAELGLAIGMEVKLVMLPKGEDPASLLLKSAPAYAAAIKSAKHIIDFSVEAIAAQNLKEREQFMKIEHEVLPLLLLLTSSIDRSYFVKRIVEKLGVKEETLWDHMNKLERAQKNSSNQRPSASVLADKNPPAPLAPSRSRQNSIERTLLGVVWWQKGLPAPNHSPDDILVRMRDIVGDERLAELQVELEPEKEVLIFEVEKYLEGSEQAGKIVESLCKDLEAEELKKQFAKTMVELRKAELMKAPEEDIEALLKKCNDISVRLMKLEKVVT